MTKQETILIADDAEINRAILRNLFADQYNLLEAENGEQALLLLRQYQDAITIVLLDLVMPVKDGYAVLLEMRKAKLINQVPVVVITAENSTDSQIKVFELGASDIIAKPFEAAVVKSRVRNIIELSRYRRSLETQVETQAARAREANAAVVDMLSSVIEYRSLESGQHIRRIRMFTKILLEEVAKNYPEYGLDGWKIQLITSASSMHDIGKIAIPDSILNKPGKLTAEEFESMKAHTVKGCELLSGLGRLQDREYLQYAYEICRYHHERWNGMGYPDGLKGNSIPLCAQVVSIADCYDALTTDRVYKKAVSPNQAYSMILNGECGVFSPLMLECFKNVQEPFARLSAEYADGLPAELNQTPLLQEEPRLWDMGENKLDQIQQKYSALLRHMDATVMEVDFDTSIYHLVYLSGQDFSALRSGGSFEASIRSFAAQSVHPDDRETVLQLLDRYIPDLFSEGLTRREFQFRMQTGETDRGIPCLACVLRVNLENPHLHRVLLVFQKKAPAPAADGMVPHSKPVIDQLLGGIQKFRCDKHLTLLQISQSLVDLSGYSEAEIRTRFHSQLLDMIYPSDREQVMREFQAQRNAGKMAELEYRLQTKDGRIVWGGHRCIISLEGGEEIAYSVLMDITQRRQAQETLRLSLERHNIIMNQTNDIIFEWDIQNDKLFLSSNWQKQYGYLPIQTDVRTEIPIASHLHPDDIPVYKGLMQAMMAGVPYKTGEFRIADAEGTYRWCQVRATAQFNLDGKPSKAVGVILDIDSQKRLSDALEARAERDALTGLYNKTAAQRRVETHLASCEDTDRSALMVLDVDNFKLVNDLYGHMFGDAVLVELSTKLSRLFRSADTVARIGGDEFLIFMPGVRQKNIAEQRAAEMIRTLHDLLQERLEGVTLSCSIGLAFSESHGIDYSRLFDQADRALYRAKASGKNQYLVFQAEMQEGPIGLMQSPAADQRTMIDSDHSQRNNLQDLITRSFDTLYGAADITQAVQSILALVGETFDVSRTYIFEDCGDGSACTNTFEWCAEGITAQIHTMRHMPYWEAGQDYRDNFAQDGLFCCQNAQKLNERVPMLESPQPVLAALQFAFLDHGKFRGFVGCDDCKMRRLWTAEQIEALTFLGKLLSVFLAKNRAQTTLGETEKNLHSVLDHQMGWRYVVDPDTYMLRYISQPTCELIPEAQLGCPCHEVFYHRDLPCEHCVLRSAQETGSSTIEHYNTFLKQWMLIDASMVNWNGRNACLISCRDISAYKQASGSSSTTDIEMI